jgi:hypothetical protein
VSQATRVAGSGVALFALVALCLPASCRQVAGLEGDFVETTSTGSTASGGGTGGAGGTTSTGGTGGAGGEAEVCANCANDKFCHLTQGCLDCLEPSHCPDAGKPACVDGKCLECATAADCPTSGDVCYSDNKCGSACVDDGDCPDLCDTNTGVCVQCLATSDCSNQICHPTQQHCVECAADGDCPGDKPRCQLYDHKCHGCLVDTDCEPGEVCNKRNCGAA